MNETNSDNPNVPIDCNVHYNTASCLLAIALQVEPDQIDLDTAIGHSERWDSLAHMRLVLALEEHMGKPLEPVQMLGIESISNVIEILSHADKG